MSQTRALSFILCLLLPCLASKNYCYYYYYPIFLLPVQHTHWCHSFAFLYTKYQSFEVILAVSQFVVHSSPCFLAVTLLRSPWISNRCIKDYCHSFSWPHLCFYVQSRVWCHIHISREHPVIPWIPGDATRWYTVRFYLRNHISPQNCSDPFFLF